MARVDQAVGVRFVPEDLATRELLEGRPPSAEGDAVLPAVRESLAALLRVLPKDEGEPS